jgi:hypothetical protein
VEFSAEHQLRSRLSETEQTIPTLVNKPHPTDNAWVFYYFERSDLL